MKRIDRILVFIVLLQLCIGVVLYIRRNRLPSPPVPELTESHPLRDEFQTLASDCRTLKEWHILAEIYTAYGFYAESEACYEFVLSKQPGDPQLLFESGFLLSQMGRCGDAYETFKAAIAAGHPAPQDCWYFIGLNFLREENPGEAEIAFLEAGDLASANLERARLKYRVGDAQAAMDLLEPVLKQEHDKIEPNVLAYLCQKELGDDLAAQQFADRAAATPKRIRGPFYTQWTRLEAALVRVGFRNRLVDAHARSEKNRQPISEATLQAALVPEWNEQSAFRLAEITMTRGDYQRAVELWKEIIDRRGPSTLSLARLADTYHAMNDTVRAVETMKQAIEAQSEENLTEVYEKLTQWSLILQNYQDAEKYAALQKLWHGKLAFWNADFTTAERYLFAAAKQMEQSDDAWFHLAETYRQLNKNDSALEAYQRCLSLNPQHGNAHRGISIISRMPSRKADD
ncbi:MAG: tetratricopeptide repeat protein [Pirellulaceae bacterium]